MMVFRKRFLIKLQKLEEWLLKEFGEKVTVEIIERIGGSINRASMFPSPGRNTAVYGVRSIFIAPYLRIYFTRKGDKFIVLNMYDMRQNPRKNRYEQK